MADTAIYDYNVVQILFCTAISSRTKSKQFLRSLKTGSITTKMRAGR